MLLSLRDLIDSLEALLLLELEGLGILLSQFSDFDGSKVLIDRGRTSTLISSLLRLSALSDSGSTSILEWFGDTSARLCLEFVT